MNSARTVIIGDEAKKTKNDTLFDQIMQVREGMDDSIEIEK